MQVFREQVVSAWHQGICRGPQVIWGGHQVIHRAGQVIHDPRQVIYRPDKVIYHPRQVIYRAQKVIYHPQQVILRSVILGRFRRFSGFEGFLAVSEGQAGVERRQGGFTGLKCAVLAQFKGSSPREKDHERTKTRSKAGCVVPQDWPSCRASAALMFQLLQKRIILCSFLGSQAVNELFVRSARRKQMSDKSLALVRSESFEMRLKLTWGHSPDRFEGVLADVCEIVCESFRHEKASEDNRERHGCLAPARIEAVADADHCQHGVTLDSIHGGCVHDCLLWHNGPSSAAAATRRADCNRVFRFGLGVT